MKRRKSSKKTVSKKKGVSRELGPDSYPVITKSLRERLRTRAPQSYDRGRNRMHVHIVEAFDCTPTRARHIVSSLVQRGYVRFGPHPNYQHDQTVGTWTYHPTTTKAAD